MLFTSYPFLGFLLVLFALYYLLPRRCQQPLLLVASYVFFACAGVGNVVYLLTTTLTTWYAAGCIGANAQAASAYLKAHKQELDREAKAAYKNAQKARRRRWLVGCLVLNIGILAVVKYAGFVLGNVNALLSVFGKGEGLSFFALALPLGISFYTFQAMSYLIDVYRGAVEAERSPLRFALFVSFFPLLIQGPISRYGDLSQGGLFDSHSFDGRQVAFGLQRVLWGYFKKLVVADRIAAAVATITAAPGEYRGAWVAVGMLFYTIQLYADFTGGIDVTIGVAQALGVTVRENFVRPYFSKSLKEYWRRWHISMCSWFRDYIFYPVSTSRALTALTRKVKGRWGDKAARRTTMYCATFLVWLCTGVWHGASWNFILWGLSNWAVLMASEELEGLYARFHARFPRLGGAFWYRLFQVGRTFALVCVLNLFDCYATLAQTAGALVSVFTVGNYALLFDGSLLTLGLTGVDYGVLALGVAAMLGVSLAQRRGSVRERIAQKPYWARFALWYGLFLLVLLLGAYGVGYDASQFIYNRF